MTTTNLYSGIGEKSSSRVLKPPGGGHSNIFGEPDACPIRARPKYNQQNSSNLSHCVGSIDANEKVVTAPPPMETAAAPTPVERAPLAAEVKSSAPAPANTQGDSKPRVPPGGFSSGFW